ncbi:hypothetical protein C8R44DRAFT_759617 [Mycena epipterygia]|nr:hypothetical protein C8R44DRAFT_759617 [Mycena epipterygia]
MDESVEGTYPLILSLPTEILLEITAYYHNTPVPYERYRKATGEEVLFGRFEVLRSLSQTCRNFRSVFLSLVWEHLEALDRTSDSTSRHMTVLKKRMMGILKTPSLPRCIRTLLVSLRLPAPNWNLFTIFVRFLEATPNLSALHIVDIAERHAGALAGILETRSFPSVCVVSVPSSLAPILCAFPNIDSLICADIFAADYDSISLLKAASKHCPSLEGLVNFMPSLPVIKSLLKHFPHVKTLKFRHVVSSEILTLLSALEDLRFIEFPHRYFHRSEKLEAVVDVAKSIFRTQQNEVVWVRNSAPEADVGDVLVRVGITPL